MLYINNLQFITLSSKLANNTDSFDSLSLSLSLSVIPYKPLSVRTEMISVNLADQMIIGERRLCVRPCISSNALHSCMPFFNNLRDGR